MKRRNRQPGEDERGSGPDVLVDAPEIYPEEPPGEGPVIEEPSKRSQAASRRGRFTSGQFR